MNTRNEHLNTSLKRTAAAALLLLGAVSSSAHAGNCQSAYNQASEFWQDVEPILQVAGCSTARIVATASGEVAIAKALKDCEKLLGGMAKVRQGIVKGYNDNTHNWSKVGKRPLISGETAEGTIVSTAGRMFVAVDSIASKKVKIEVKERDGKNKTSVTYCVRNSNGDLLRRDEHVFNNSKAAKKNTGEIHTAKFDIKPGEMVLVHLDGKSVANKFKYKIKSSTQ